MQCRLAILIVSCCFVCGCRLGPVNTPSFADDPSVRRIDPNNGVFRIIEIERPNLEPGAGRLERRIQWTNPRIDPNLQDAPTFAVPYRGLDFRLFSQVSVPVQLGQGRRHWALVDTGFPDCLYINDAVVWDGDLAVFPLGKHPDTRCDLGLCEVPSMRIGQATVANPPCWYEQRQWQLRLLGLPLYRSRMVLIGLRFLQAFSYVQFDNARHEVVFSPYETFEPNDPSQWFSVPFVLEEVAGERRMMVDISLAGRAAHVEFDTGGAKPGLLLRDSVWKDLGGAVGSKRRHASYQFGWLPCRRVVVPELHVGPLILKDCKADILPEDNPLPRDLAGILSLHYFRRTTVVLDFHENRIWLRAEP